MARRPSSVLPSVNFCANRFFSQTNGRIATKLSQDGLQVSLHPGCAQGQGQGQRSRDTRTFWILEMSYSVIDGLVNVCNVPAPAAAAAAAAQKPPRECKPPPRWAKFLILICKHGLKNGGPSPSWILTDGRHKYLRYADIFPRTRTSCYQLKIFNTTVLTFNLNFEHSRVNNFILNYFA